MLRLNPDRRKLDDRLKEDDGGVCGGCEVLCRGCGGASSPSTFTQALAWGVEAALRAASACWRRSGSSVEYCGGEDT